jgi:heme exporter protein CcmD
MLAVSAALGILSASSLAVAAEVDTPPASCFAHPERWTYDRKNDALATPGKKFLDDMQACDATFAAAVTESVRYQIQQEEHDKFVKHSSFLIAAYGIVWAVVAGAALTIWLRQRRLIRDLAELEARLKAAGAGS